MTFLARSLALATTLALLPGTALASPGTTATPLALAALQTVAVANDAGVAQALTQPATGTTVTVVVSTGTGPAATPTPAATTPVPPAPCYTPPPYADRIHRDRKSGRSLLIAGITTGVTVYVYTSLAGAVTFDKARVLDPLSERRREQREYGRALMIPGIGPALAISKAHTAMQAWAAGMAGVAQAAALTMTLVGSYRLSRARRFERLSLAAMASGQQAHVSLGMRF